MASAIQHQEYELRFDPDEKRVEFRAAGIVQALTRAGRLIKPGRSATLLEDGVPIGVLAADGRLTIQERSGPRRAF